METSEVMLKCRGNHPSIIGIVLTLNVSGMTTKAYSLGSVGVLCTGVCFQMLLQLCIKHVP